jgi:1,4-dihydroxy-2-naphthoate octaprenyltransferase
MTSKTTGNPFLGTMRLPFLILTPACVLLGTAAAVWAGYIINWLYFSLALAGAVSAHVSVNALNEYFDFKSGLDLKTRRTPFSGGSGSLPANPEKSYVALATGITTFLLTAAIGIYFMTVWGWKIFPLGLFGLLIIGAYTTWITKQPIACLMAPGLGFGVLMVMGTYFVLTGHYSMTAFVASLVPFFLVSNLLLLNQFPDVDADSTIGRRHFPIIIGKSASARIYIVFLVCAYISVLFGYLSGLFPLTGLLALGSLFLAIPTMRGVLKYAESISELIPFLGKNVAIVIFTPVLLAVGMFVGKFLNES